MEPAVAPETGLARGEAAARRARRRGIIALAFSLFASLLMWTPAGVHIGALVAFAGVIVALFGLGSAAIAAVRRRPTYTAALFCFVAVVWTVGVNGWLAWRFVSKDPAPGETAALSELHTLNTAMTTYNSAYKMGFPDTLHRFRTPSAYGKPTYNNADLFRAVPFLADIRLSGRIFTWLGYEFTYTPGAGKFGDISSYTISARPVETLELNKRSFFTDQTGMIRWTLESRAANRDDPPL